MTWFKEEARFISRSTVETMCDRLIDEAVERHGIKKLQRVLVLPPDLTRAHSNVG